MVDDDDGDETPSPEPQTGSRSALLREIRAWRRLRIIKHDETFSLIFFRESKYIELEFRRRNPPCNAEDNMRAGLVIIEAWFRGY